MSTGEEGYLKKGVSFIMYICKKWRILSPCFTSSGRGVSKKLAKLLKIDIVIGNAKLLQKLVKSIFSVS